MQKRLTKSDFLLAYTIIITLACAIGGFFFGAYYMKAEYEAAKAAALEAEKLEAEKERLLKEQKLYNEQDFIRFHYAVYAPALSLKRAHFETMENWTRLDRDAREESLDHLVETAEETLSELQKSVSLPTSPLLQKAQANFRNSVQAYLDGMKQLQRVQNKDVLTADEISEQLAPMQESWLTAQEQVYLSFATWESAYVLKKPLPQAEPLSVTVEQWKQYPFLYRTYLSAAVMTTKKEWKAFNPEDLTAHLDNLFSAKDASGTGIKDLPGGVGVLYAAQAIQPDAFKQQMPKKYAREKLPEVPLFH